uniref:Uncharacterized protein n=1 Tax=Anguilla anguilla TaxID=7936 RepID=A0A0E9PUZ5_ANGAN
MMQFTLHRPGFMKENLPSGIDPGNEVLHLASVQPLLALPDVTFDVLLQFSREQVQLVLLV